MRETLRRQPVGFRLLPREKDFSCLLYKKNTRKGGGLMWRSPLVEGYNLQRLSKTFPSRHKGFLGVLYRRVSQVKRWQLNFPRACVYA